MRPLEEPNMFVGRAREGPARVANNSDSSSPRVVELLRKAMEWQARIEFGEASNQAAIARQEGITRARVTQVMGLLRLAPQIQQRVLSLPDMIRRPTITERTLRPITQLENVTDQKAEFEGLIEQVV